MALKIAYCPDHGAVKTVVGAGADLAGAVHMHPDTTKHPCIIVSTELENQPASYPHTTGESTTVNNPQEWLTYLERYVP